MGSSESSSCRVHPVDLAFVRLDPLDEALVVPVLCPNLFDLAFDLDHYDLFLKRGSPGTPRVGVAALLLPLSWLA
ncbi:UNVERIFIED_CONTAM: hypothetical protein Slati_3455200 [Sesamum latifolium]|uniref:Uncharacterized protein n=1 Tax=Sesamum latifolium TaxID=2727402 RepID=A0AAW2UGE3_9LAMI